MKHNLNLKVRPEWQPAIIGWRRFVAARPDLHLTSGHNGLNWFIRNHRQRALQSGVMCKINGMWLCHVEKFPAFAFDAMLAVSTSFPNSALNRVGSSEGGCNAR
jgi:hypothetical protein